MSPQNLNSYQKIIKKSKSFSLFYSDFSNKTWTKIILSSSVLSILFFHILHFSLVIHTKVRLDNYAKDIFFKSKQLDFQIKRGLSLAESEAIKLCSPEDLDFLRNILDKYYYLDDIGRVINKQIVCTVKKGFLEQSEQLLGGSVVSTNKIHYWNSQNKLFNYHYNQPTFSYGNSVSFISRAFLADLDSGIPIRNDSGGYLYLKDRDYIFKVYGRIGNDQILQEYDKKTAFYNWFLLPGSLISSRVCEGDSDICLLNVVKSISVFNLPYVYVALIALCIFIPCFLIAIIFHSFEGGPTFFLRRLGYAIKTGNIYPLYQPKVCVSGGAVVGVESLARWNDSMLGEIPPALFMAVAEQTNLMKSLTEKLIEKIFQELRVILEEKGNFSVSINIPSSLLIDDALLPFLNHEHAKYQFKRSQIILEITEVTFANSDEMAKAALLVKKEGYLISLDDFGTGYSNLSWLTTLNPDEIKVDKMFTQAANTQTVNNIALEGMFSLINHLNVKVVFEGIETEQQNEYIRARIPNAIGQGWFFGKPQPIDDLIAYVERQNVQG